MRIPDTLLRNSFMVHFNKSKKNLANIETQLITQSLVNKPSDNPLSNSRIMRLQNQLSSIDTYKSNISYGKSILSNAILSMESMHDEIQNLQVQLTQLNSAAINSDLSSFAQSIDSSLEIILEMANSDFDGQYNFGGTESGTKPFSYDDVNKRVVINSEHLGGNRVVKISSSITQKFNITGKELFQSVFSQTGNLDSTAGIGVAQTETSTIYDSESNEYTLNLTYTQTAANTYELNYSILDSGSNVIETKTVSDIKFNSDTGEFESIAGETFGEIHIENAANKIDFVIDLNSLTEKNSSTNLKNSLSQKADIFNTLISIRDNLLAGEKPTEDQVQLINDFNQHLLNKLSLAGGIFNKLESTENILENRVFEITELLSIEKDVDIAKALLDLESAQYSLDLSYKISTMILPRSLLDYM